MNNYLEYFLRHFDKWMADMTGVETAALIYGGLLFGRIVLKFWAKGNVRKERWIEENVDEPLEKLGDFVNFINPMTRRKRK